MTANVMERNWVVVSVVVAMLCTAAAMCGEPGADARIGFRGDGTGSFPDAQPPVKWSATENVIWKTPMPGRSNGAPIVVGDRAFTCSEPSSLLCVSAEDGKIRWSDTVTYFDYVPEDDPEAAAIIAKVNGTKTEKEKEAIKESLKKDIMRCDYFEKPPVMGSHFGFILEYTLPTPTSDGKQVYVVYGTGMAAAYGLDGKRQWVRALDKPRSATGYSANPLLAGGRLVINMGGFLQGLDTASGKTAWKVDHDEYFGSPVRAEVGGTELVVMPMGNVYRASDGKLLGKGAAINSQLTASVHGDTVYSAWDESFSSVKGPKLPPGANYLVMAVRLKATADGTIATEKLWETTERPGGYSSPVYHNGLIYNTCSRKTDSGDKLHLVAFDATAGKLVYAHKLGVGSWQNAGNYPCTTHAGPYIYAPLDDGKMFVIKPGREYQEVAFNDLSKGGLWQGGDQMVGAPLFVGNRIYVRTRNFLFCIGNK